MRAWVKIISLMVLMLGGVSSLSYAEELPEEGFAPLSQEQLDSYVAPLRAIDRLEAAYIQRKKHPVLEHTLISEGRFIYFRDKGVIWQMSSPFEITTVITPTEHYQLDGKGDRVPQDTSAALMAPVVSMIFSLFSGDLAPLSDKFSFAGKRDEKLWHIKLLPRNDPLKSYIKSLYLDGADVIQKVTIIGMKGDKTSITFTNHKQLSSDSPSNAVTENDFILFAK